MFKTDQTSLKPLLSAIVFTAVMTMSVNADTIWHGYYDSEEPLSEFGTGISEDYSCAIYLPGDVGIASGKSIKGIRCTIQGTVDMTNLKVWMSTELPKSPDKADITCYDIEISGISDGVPFETILSEPYWVPDKGIYIGYSFSAEDPFPVLTTAGNTTEQNGFYINTSSTYPGWRDFTPYRYGNLAIEVLLEGEVYENTVSVSYVPEIVCLPGEKLTIPVTLTNYGIDGVTSIEYTLTEDDGEGKEFVYELPVPVTRPKEQFVMNLDFTAADTKGISYKEINVTGVNGRPNGIDYTTTGRGAVITIEESARRTTVMEEFTGTWCGWCPRGMVGIKQLSEDFGDSFIGIAVHGGNDPMVIEAYSDILGKVNGFPSCILDREITGDPFFGSTYGIGSEPSYGIRNDVEKQLEKLTPAAVALETEWSDNDKTIINATALLKLMYPRTDTPAYSIAYVLCADGLDGSDPSWMQNNDFSLPIAQDYRTDPYLGWLTEAGARIRDIVYNDVAVEAYDIDNGMPLKTNDEEWSGDNWVKIDNRTFSIGGNTLIQDKDKLSLVAMIIDDADGRIVNAAKVAIGDSNLSKKEEITEVCGAEISEVYDLYGIRRDRPVKGINIVRYSDGSSRKIIINQ